jgi:hypothetical protein
MAETAKAKLDEIVSIDGKKYKFTGDVDFSNLKIEKIGDDVPNPDPEPQDPAKPTEGFIKPGGWGADLVNKAAWKVVNMKDFPEQFKVVDAAGKNVATNFTAQKIAENFIAYFQTHEFPPKDTNPTPEPGPTPEPNPNPTPGSGVDKNGVKLLVSNGGEITYEVKNNFRDDGKRYDVNVGQWPSSEATAYFRFTKDPVDDEVSIKWSEKSHSGSNDVQCYDTGTDIKSGKTRMRFENPHPSYSGNIGGGQGSPQGTKWIGYKGVKQVNADGTVTIKLWQDTGDNEGDKPANQWKETYSHTDSKYKRTGAHPYVTFRVDDPGKNGQKNLEIKWVSVAKVISLSGGFTSTFHWTTP